MITLRKLCDYAMCGDRGMPKASAVRSNFLQPLPEATMSAKSGLFERTLKQLLIDF